MVASGGDGFFAAWEERHRLNVVARSCAGVVACLVIHAPGGRLNDTEDEGCWSETTAVAQAAAQLFFFADANAIVGSVNSSAIGACGWKVKGSRGAAFHKILAFHRRRPDIAECRDSATVGLRGVFDATEQRGRADKRAFGRNAQSSPRGCVRGSGVERSGPSAAERGMSHEQIQEDWTKAPPLFP